MQPGVRPGSSLKVDAVVLAEIRRDRLGAFFGLGYEVEWNFGSRKARIHHHGLVSPRRRCLAGIPGNVLVEKRRKAIVDGVRLEAISDAKNV